MVTVAMCNFCVFHLAATGPTVVHVVPVRLQTIGVLQWLTGSTSRSGLSDLVNGTLNLFGFWCTVFTYEPLGLKCRRHDKPAHISPFTWDSTRFPQRCGAQGIKKRCVFERFFKRTSQDLLCVATKHH